MTGRSAVQARVGSQLLRFAVCVLEAVGGGHSRSWQPFCSWGFYLAWDLTPFPRGPSWGLGQVNPDGVEPMTLSSQDQRPIQ